MTEFVKFWRDANKYAQLPVWEEADALKEKMGVKYFDRRSKFYLSEYANEIDKILGIFKLDDISRIIFKTLLEKVEKEMIVTVINVYLYKIE